MVGGLEKPGELFRRCPQPLLKNTVAGFSIGKGGYRVPRHHGELDAKVLVKVHAKRGLFKSVRPVHASERAFAVTGHKPQSECLAGCLHRADDREISFPFIQDSDSASLHRRTPLVGGAKSRDVFVRDNQRDALDSGEGILDVSRVLAAPVVLKPAEHDAEALFGARWRGGECVRDAKLQALRGRNILDQNIFEPQHEQGRDQARDNASDNGSEQFH